MPSESNVESATIVQNSNHNLSQHSSLTVPLARPIQPSNFHSCENCFRCSGTLILSFFDALAWLDTSILHDSLSCIYFQSEIAPANEIRYTKPKNFIQNSCLKFRVYAGELNKIKDKREFLIDYKFAYQ